MRACVRANRCRGCRGRIWARRRAWRRACPRRLRTRAPALRAWTTACGATTPGARSARRRSPRRTTGSGRTRSGSVARREHADRGEEGERRTASAMSFMLGLISIPAVWARTLTRKEAIARGRACVSVRRLMVVRARGVFCVHRAWPGRVYKRYTVKAACDVTADGSQEPFERVMSCASKIDGASSRAVGSERCRGRQIQPPLTRDFFPERPRSACQDLSMVHDWHSAATASWF